MIENNAARLESIAINKNDVLKEWWMKPSFRWLAPYYCRYKDMTIIKIDSDAKIGHEIFGLMQKNDQATVQNYC